MSTGSWRVGHSGHAFRTLPRLGSIPGLWWWVVWLRGRLWAGSACPCIQIGGPRVSGLANRIRPVGWTTIRNPRSWTTTWW